MKLLRITITRFIDEHQPGFVEGKFTDAHGLEHTVQEKVPVVSQEDLWTDSEYPRYGVIACLIEGTAENAEGQTILTINTLQPWGVETLEGLTVFDVFAHQVIDRP